MKDLRLARGGKRGVAGEACRERPPRGPPPRARAGSLDAGPVRRDRRPRPSQGHPGAVPAVADEPAAARVPARRGRPARARRRGFPGRDPQVAGAVQPGPAARRRTRGERSPSGSPTTGWTSTDPGGFDGSPVTSTTSTPSTGRAATGCSTSRPSRRSSPRSSAQLGRVGLDHEHHDGGWRRVVIEKPFGHDLESAKRLNREVGKVFRESQVYRIDHYLGKETVRNLLVFRFGNGIFEPLWNRRYVDHVQITVAESIGDRGPRRVLRADRRVARRPPEPPAPAGQPRRDGAAGEVRGRRAARREGQGPAGDLERRP